MTKEYKQEYVEQEELSAMYAFARLATESGHQRVVIDPKDLTDIIAELLDIRAVQSRKITTH